MNSLQYENSPYLSIFDVPSKMTDVRIKAKILKFQNKSEFFFLGIQPRYSRYMPTNENFNEVLFNRRSSTLFRGVHLLIEIESTCFNCFDFTTITSPARSAKAGRFIVLVEIASRIVFAVFIGTF